MDASKVSDEEILRDLQMLPEGGKEVCMNLINILAFNCVQYYTIRLNEVF